MPSMCCKPRLEKMHRATIKRPGTSLDDRGQIDTTPTVVKANIPCGLAELSGREFELARQQVANATHRVEITLDPAWNVKPTDFLVLTKASSKQLTLNIGHVKNVDGVDREHDLLCGENV